MKIVPCAVLAAGIASSFAAVAQQPEGNWMVRFRATNLGMKNSSDAGSGTLNPALLPSDSLKAADKTIPEVDISYFFAPNWAAELILTVPQRHDVRISQGPLAETVGSFKHLPPTLLAQYHFNPSGTFRPYVGAGVNYTIISGVSLNSTKAPTVNLKLENHSVGLAYQIGADYRLENNWFLNVDLKKIYIDTDLMANGVKSSHLELDPLAFSVGFGKRF